jgi:hypothetical protein
VELHYDQGPLRLLHKQHYGALEKKIEERMLAAHGLAQIASTSMDDEEEIKHCVAYIAILVDVYTLLGLHPKGVDERQKLLEVFENNDIELMELPSRKLAWRFK